MQENNFEKQVQQKMDELSLNPSGEVWQKISVNIAKEKNGRRFFIIVPLLLLMIGSTVYLVFNHWSNKAYQIASSKENVSSKIEGNNNLIKEDEQNSKTHQNNSTKISDLNMNTKVGVEQSAQTSQREKTDKKIENRDAENSARFSQKNTQDNNSYLKPVAVDKAKKVVYKTRQELKLAISENTPGDLTDENLAAINSFDVEEAADEKFKKPPYLVNDIVTESARNYIKGVGTIISMSQLNDSVLRMLTTNNKNQFEPTNSTPLSKRRGWDFGINFSVGAATTQAGLLGVVGSGSGDGSKAASDLAQNNPGGVTSGNPIVYYPSRVKTGAGIVIGGFTQKRISTRSAIVLGFNFKRLNSSMMTGAKVDSTGFINSNNFSSRSIYYRNGNQQIFKNHFYFIELPVSIKLQLNKLKKVPVYLTTGFNFARLINTNALQFDQTNGIYYHDNTLLNKTQLSGSLGVLFSLNANGKNPLLFGPDIQYSFNKMADAGLYTNRHYSFIGLTLQKIIGKK